MHARQLAILAALLAVTLVATQLLATVGDAQQQPISAIAASGPEHACSGQTIAYDIRYETPANTPAYFVLSHPKGTLFVSAETIEGAPGSFGPPNPDATDTWSWHTQAPATGGTVRVTVVITPGFTGVTGIGARVPGTGTIHSNSVTTAVAKCVHLPGTGAPPQTGAPSSPWDTAAYVLLACGLVALFSSRVLTRR